MPPRAVHQQIHERFARQVMIGRDRLPCGFDFAASDEAPHTLILRNLPLNCRLVFAVAESCAVATMDDLALARSRPSAGAKFACSATVTRSASFNMSASGGTRNRVLRPNSLLSALDLTELSCRKIFPSTFQRPAVGSGFDSSLIAQGGTPMCETRITVQQIRSAIRRHRKQRQTLIALKLNRIGRIAELPDTPQTRGMIAKVKHLVRIIGQETELDCFVRAVRAEYHELITTRIGRGEVLWAQFEAAVEACRADPKGDDRQITEKVNEMAVAKVLLEHEGIWPITYEPDLLPDGRKIDSIAAPTIFISRSRRSGLAPRTRKPHGRSSSRGESTIPAMFTSSSRRNGSAVPFTATCLLRGLTFSNTHRILRRASRLHRRSSPVMAC
jgi:large subunit ribosomal protein L30